MVLRSTHLLTGFPFNKRLIYLILAILLIAGILGYYNRGQTDYESIDFLPIDEIEPEYNISLIQLDDVLRTEPRPVPGRSIFFLETSNVLNMRVPSVKQRMASSMLHLSARQACAIESAARHNPNFQIYVLFARPTYRYHTYGSQSRQPVIDAIVSYKNVHLRQLDIWNYAAGTPIEKWLLRGDLFGSSFLTSHVSDFLRFLTLYRFGGIYMDLDVVVLRSLEDLPPNYTAAESNVSLAAGVMSFEPTDIGHFIARACLKDFEKRFAGNIWGNNGPGVITRVMQQICNTNNITLMIEEHEQRCRGFQIFGPKAFYAIVWDNWRYFFEPQHLNDVLNQTKDSYLIHLWNKETNRVSLRVNSNAPYTKLAKQHCHKSFAAAGQIF